MFGFGTKINLIKLIWFAYKFAIKMPVQFPAQALNYLSGFIYPVSFSNFHRSLPKILRCTGNLHHVQP